MRAFLLDIHGGQGRQGRQAVEEGNVVVTCGLLHIAGALWFWIMHGALALGPQLLFAKLYLAHHGSAGAVTSSTSSTSKRNKAE